MAQKPNIVLVLADDMGYGDLSCQNPSSKISTPHLDRMAADGVRFTDAHASSSLCTPSRYGLLTGRYSWRGKLQRGVSWGWSLPLLEEGRPTLATLLASQGYTTACIGKWHLGLGWGSRGASPDIVRHPEGYEDIRPEDVDYGKPLSAGPHTAGFHSFFGIPASLDMQPYCWIENDHVVEPPTETVAASPWDAYFRGGPISPGFKHREVLPILFDKAVTLIRNHGRGDTPFFLYLPLTAPHTPILPLPPFAGKSGAGEYGDFVMMCDHGVGRMRAALEETGELENTLFIFTSDNGCERNAYERARITRHFSMGDLRGLKRDLWEGGHRIPLVVRWGDQVAPGLRCDDPVCLTDIFATVAEITGAPLPRDAAEDSISLLPLLEGARSSSPRRDHVIHQSGSSWFALRKDGWVFIDNPTGDDNEEYGEPAWLKKERGYQPHDFPGELYDLERDPSEKINLYGREPRRVSEMAAILQRIRSAGGSRT